MPRPITQQHTNIVPVLVHCWCCQPPQTIATHRRLLPDEQAAQDRGLEAHCVDLLLFCCVQSPSPSHRRASSTSHSPQEASSLSGCWKRDGQRHRRKGWCFVWLGLVCLGTRQGRNAIVPRSCGQTYHVKGTGGGFCGLYPSAFFNNRPPCLLLGAQGALCSALDISVGAAWLQACAGYPGTADRFARLAGWLAGQRYA